MKSHIETTTMLRAHFEQT